MEIHWYQPDSLLVGKMSTKTFTSTWLNIFPILCLFQLKMWRKMCSLTIIGMYGSDHLHIQWTFSNVINFTKLNQPLFECMADENNTWIFSLKRLFNGGIYNVFFLSRLKIEYDVCMRVDISISIRIYVIPNLFSRILVNFFHIFCRYFNHSSIVHSSSMPSGFQIEIIGSIWLFFIIQ